MVSAEQTKSAYRDPAYTTEELTALEKKVVNAYFIIFNKDGKRHGEVKKLNVDENNIIESCSVRTDVNNDNITACFLANVPEDYAMAIDHVNDLTEIPLELEYAAYESTGYIGIPRFDFNEVPTPDDPTDDIECFPMFGLYPDKISSDQITIPLKRLFAKVEVNMEMDMRDELTKTFGDLMSEWVPVGGLLDTYIGIKKISVNNLPKKVFLAARTNDSVTDVLTSSNLSADTDFISAEEVSYNPSNRLWDKNSQDAVDWNKELKKHSFVFYVPEYAIIPEGSTENNDQTNKPSLLGSSQKAVSVSLSGLFHRFDNTNAEVTYNIYLGEDNSDSFSLFRNNFYKNNVSLNGTGHLNGGADNRVEKHPLNLVEVYGESANCYIVTVDGDYVIDTYAGAFSNITANTPKVTGTPEVLWSDGNNAVTCRIDEEDPTKIIVSVMPQGDALAEGNAVISIPGGWSWHLWIVPASDNNELVNLFLGSLEEQTYQVTNAVMLNRNLGASGPTDTGAYYKWGDNKPYFNNAYQGAGTAPSYTWTDGDSDATNDVKQRTDPCPPGYFVPSSGTWLTEAQWKNTPAANTASIGSLVGDGYFPYDINLLVNYPYSGYIDAAGTKQKNTNLSEGAAVYMKEVRLPHEQTPWGTTMTYGDILRPSNPQRFQNVNYRINDIAAVGYSAARDNKVFQYGYENKGLEIISCTFQRGTWIKSGSWLSTKYNASYEGSNLLIDKPLTGDQLKEQYPEEYNKLVERIQVINAGNVLDNLLGSITISVIYNSGEAANTSYGYPVRCVKE